MNMDGDYQREYHEGHGATPAELRLQQQCRQSAETRLRTFVKQVFDKADDLLFERSNASAADAGDFFNALRVLRLERQEIEQRCVSHFSREYQQRLQRAPTSAAPADRPPPAGLSLIDEKELEESLAIEGLVGKAKERFRAELHALTLRYQVIVPGVAIAEATHPLAPDVICDAFREALDGVDLGVAIKLIIYKLFEQYVLKNLGMLYDEVNTVLLDAGVLPQLKASAVTRGGERSAPTPAAEPPNAAPSPDGLAPPVPAVAEGAAAGDGDVYQTLQRLMSRKKYGTAGPHEVGSDGLDPPIGGGNGYGQLGGPPLGADTLLQGLSQLQQQPLPADNAAGESGIAYIKASLLQQLGGAAAGRAIDPVHDNTIDVIGMIFEFILDESSIPEVVKRLLNQLQIPILKVAIADKEFFTQKHHPARRLLNTLGRASIGWNDKDAATQQRRFQKMEYVVERVLREYQTEPGLFAELLKLFTDFLAGEDEDFPDDKPQEDAAQAPAASPEQQAFEAIAERLDDAELPPAARTLLREVWHKVMAVAAEQGVDSECWRRRRQTIDDLAWSVTPKKTGDDRRRMVALLPRLLGALQDGMRGAGYAPADIDAALAGLEPIHMACLRGEVATAPSSPAPASHEVSAMIRSLQQELGDSMTGHADPGAEHAVRTPSIPYDDHAWDAAEQVLEDSHTDTARSLAIGTWLEFEQGGKKRRGKLGWKSSVLGQYVFVDRRYKVVAEKTLAEFAADLRAGRVAVAAHVGMFDRALDKVLNGLLAGAGK